MPLFERSIAIMSGASFHYGKSATAMTQCCHEAAGHPQCPYTQSGRGIPSGFHGLIAYRDTAAGYFPPLSFFPNSGSILRNADTAKVREHVSTTMMKNIR